MGPQILPWLKCWPISESASADKWWLHERYCDAMRAFWYRCHTTTDLIRCGSQWLASLPPQRTILQPWVWASGDWTLAFGSRNAGLFLRVLLPHAGDMKGAVLLCECCETFPWNHSFVWEYAKDRPRTDASELIDHAMFVMGNINGAPLWKYRLQAATPSDPFRIVPFQPKLTRKWTVWNKVEDKKCDSHLKVYM